MKKRFKRMILVLIVLVTALAAAVYVFLQQPPFGQLPTGQRLARIQQSPNYRDGSFQNLSPTPDLAEDASYVSVMREFLFGKHPRNQPKDRLPSQKVDLRALEPDENVLVWFGHSSYFMQVDGKTILVDPVLSGSASPVSFTTRSYPGADAYTVENLPEIDFLFISHDHWDHLDYESVVALKTRVGKVITGLGTGEHLERWGYRPDQLLEGDWYDHFALGDGFAVDLAPARHFSGRGLSRNKVLWTSFALQTPTLKLYLGGDSGYDTHFAEIGRRFGPFDLALLECGQYDKSWKYIHMMPEEVVQAAQDLQTARLMPVHWAKFSLGNHAWDDPIVRVSAAARAQGMPLVTPVIGQSVKLKDTAARFPAWWEAVK